MIAAHRGNAFEFPENSIEAIRSAIGLGVPVEFDAQVSRDGVAVVAHDGLIYRDERPLIVHETSFAELGLPSLEEVIGLFPFGHLFFVEIKTYGFASQGFEFVVDCILDLLPIWAPVLSFYKPALLRARKRHFEIGWNLNQASPSIMNDCAQFEPEYLTLNIKESSCVLPRGHWLWIGYEASTWQDVLQFRELGCDIVLTGNPRALRD